jgi:hypothetical protein
MGEGRVREDFRIHALTLILSPRERRSFQRTEKESRTSRSGAANSSALLKRSVMFFDEAF